MFKENVERLCRERGIAPSALCSAIGLNKSAYSQWTSETKPRNRTVQLMCQYLGVSEEEITGDNTGKIDLQLFAEEEKEKSPTSDVGDRANVKRQYLINLYDRMSREEQDGLIRQAEETVLRKPDELKK
mgnify:CR=1 FL=1